MARTRRQDNDQAPEGRAHPDEVLRLVTSVRPRVLVAARRHAECEGGDHEERNGFDSVQEALAPGHDEVVPGTAASPLGTAPKRRGETRETTGTRRGRGR